MPKAIIEFDLSDYHDKNSHKRVMAADDMASFIFYVSLNMKKDIQMKLQAMELENKKLRKSVILDMVMTKIWDTLKQYNLDPEELNQ